MLPNRYIIVRRSLIPSLLMLALFLFACKNSSFDRSAMQSDPPMPDQAELFFLNGGTLYSTGDLSRRWRDNKIVNLTGSGKPQLDRLDLDLHFDRLKNIVWSQLILDSMTYDRLGIKEQDALEFYSAHPDSFRFDDRWAEVIHLGFLHFEDADTAAQRLNSNPKKLDSLLVSYNFDHQLVQFGHLPEILDSVIFKLSVSKRFRGPIETDHGHHLILVKKRYEKGNRIPFLFVREKLIQALAQANYYSTKSMILDSLYKDFYDRL